MALQAVPGYFGKVGFQHPMTLLRNFNEALFRKTGAVRNGDWSLTPLAGLNLSVGAGAANIIGLETDQKQGSYFVWSEAAQTIPWTSPSGSPRIDALIVRIHDDDYGSITGLPRCEWEIVAGTPSGSPVIVPDSAFAVAGSNYIPGAWWRVANIRLEPSDTTINPANILNAAGTAAITAASEFCYAPRSILTVGTPTGGVAGDVAYDVSGAGFWRNVAGTWVPEYAITRRLAADTTPTWTNNTTVSNVNGFAWTGLPANSRWRLIGNIHYVGTGGGFKFTWTGPSGYTMDYKFVGYEAVGNAFVGRRVTQADTPGFGGGGHGGIGAIDIVNIEGSVIIAGTAGTLQLQAAQFVSNGGATVIKAESHLDLIRIS